MWETRGVAVHAVAAVPVFLISRSEESIAAMRTGETIVTLGFVAIGAHVFYEISTSFVELGIAGGGGRDNAALFPGILAGLLLLVSGLHIANGVRRRRREETPVIAVERMDPPPRAAGSVALQLWLLGIFLVYLVLIDIVGYLVMTPLALFAMFRLLGVKRIVANAIVSIVATLAVWYLFSELMRIPMPPGRFGLYL